MEQKKFDFFFDQFGRAKVVYVIYYPIEIMNFFINYLDGCYQGICLFEDSIFLLSDFDLLLIDRKLLKNLNLKKSHHFQKGFACLFSP